ncbi:MAG: ATP phosphoribosyltransferase regulatory subunit [Paracoccus sp. (in: a-proteobacteria)]|nr:ATP phosphoribosyltransferase regulatory subunit [Paracoccus sp. (in: a-proteobacteria)]
MISKAEKRVIGQRLLSAFRAAGAVEIAPDILLPAGTLLDLYGEDIRARAYVTSDPIRGEVMLRPDFTVPVVRAHMDGGAEPARYCYLGEVFRKQDHGDARPEQLRDNEYLQAGFELFSRDPGADAEIFALFYRILAPYDLRPVMGDMGLLTAAVAALPLSQARRRALAHHLWRPRRLSRLLSRYSRPAPAREFAETDAPWTGMRSGAEMEARIASLRAEPDEPPLPAEWSDRLARLFSVDAPAPEALEMLDALAAEINAIAPPLARLRARIEAIAVQGIDPGAVRLSASHGQREMEYYDGMTFSFRAESRPDWPPIASGGRYDAMTRMLGQGREIPAVGGIIRPGLLAELAQTAEGARC